MSKQMQMEEEMFLANKKFQHHNLKMGFKRISENGGKMLMQVIDQYFTTKICIFLLFGK